MEFVNRALKRKVALAVALAALLAGGAVAAMAASGPSGHHKHAGRHGVDHRGAIGLRLQAAAGYLGIPAAQLKQDLQSGKTLAQLATTNGKSEAGLIVALVTARRAQLAKISASLDRRVAAEVNRVHGHGVAARHGARAAVRNYLGLTPAQLHSQLRAGRTLAQIANATTGKSAGGLVAAIVAARQGRLDAASAAGKLSKTEADARTAALTKRVTRMVNKPLRGHAFG
jgi:hypothetical protein